MSRPNAQLPSPRLSRCTGFGLAGLLLLNAAPAPADQSTGLYPPASLFRSLQLTALACGRDNDAASCDKARAMADPLLDHPRLSATCKDTLWAIRQNALAAPANSPERRDRIDKAAKDLTVFCRQPGQPTAAGGSGTKGSGSSGPGSFFSAPVNR